jgi:hypothetical protein
MDVSGRFWSQYVPRHPRAAPEETSIANDRVMNAVRYVCVAVLLSGTVLSAQPASVTTPAAGSPVRRAILDALRAHLGIKSRFQVDHLKVAGAWAYLRCGEVVELDGHEVQETDLSVAALLERGADGKWVIVESWTLPSEDQHPFAAFVKRVKAREASERLPHALFPPDY